jgi:hypothetical protein
MGTELKLSGGAHAGSSWDFLELGMLCVGRWAHTEIP